MTSTPNLSELEKLLLARANRHPSVVAACDLFDRSCIKFLQENEPKPSDDLEADKAFVKRVVSLPALALSKEDLFIEGASLQDFVEARLEVYVTQLVNHGRIKTATVVQALGTSRESLANANTLIEKMILAGIVDIDLKAANLALQSDPVGWQLLKTELAPLTLRERSMRRSFDGELLYVLWSVESGGGHLGFKPQHVLNFTHKINAAHGYDSEASWPEYWSSELKSYHPSVFDYLIDPLNADSLGYKDPDYPKHMGLFVAELQSLEGKMHILRALHQSPIREAEQVPTIEPLPHWAWVWQDEASLCLKPELIHPSREKYATPICLDWVGDVLPDV